MVGLDLDRTYRTAPAGGPGPEVPPARRPPGPL